ncbi:MAG: cysteine--tRNA ligase [Coriobacteriales bacterium]|jgi:cysteinyl-tRNA synthetase
MKIYNTLTRKKEEFVPITPGKIGMYVCGPTVYNHIHVGNARTFVSFDVIRRHLENSGYEVTFVSNLTDVDDKIINRANEEGTTAADIAEKYSKSFIEAMDALGVKRPTVRPRATQEIDAMIATIEKLIDKGHAYVVDGDVYFSVRSDNHYGVLSGRSIDEMMSGARIDVDPRKHDPLDFALWKSAKPGEPSWDSPWGKGRPGWHIECSSMSAKYLGQPFDIHGGGVDLVFPHHENEIAQAECAEGKKFCNYWMHAGMLLVDSEKMSKSLGNFLLLKDVLETLDPRVLRVLMLQTHYRSPLDYSKERLDEASASFDRIATTLRNIEWEVAHASEDNEPSDSQALLDSISNCETRYVEAMDDDFNTAAALGEVFTLVSDANAFIAGGINPSDVDAANAAHDAICDLMGRFGIDMVGEAEGSDWPDGILDLASKLAGYDGSDKQEAARVLLDARAEARKAKNWGLADQIRDELGDLGFTVEDTPAGARLVF